jgi:glycosyltransferase involved in cell wall biosynthesis
MPMRIIHVNYDAGHSGGATIAAVRIHQALLGNGVASEFVSVLNNGPIVAGKIFPNDPWRCLSRCIRTVLYRGFWKVLKIREYPPNLLHTGMAKYLNRLKPDLVHLHWVKADTISIKEIGSIHAPIVWSLHDLWPCLGTDSYPQNKRFKTGYDGVQECRGIDRWTWRRKMKAFHGRHIIPVGPSAWCAQQARESLIFHGHRVESIPYPVDVTTFIPRDRHLACLKWRIPPDRFVVLFGANMGTQWRIKGFDRLAESLQYVDPGVKDKMHIVVFGESSSPRVLHGVPVQFVGSVASEAEMATLYPAGDLFAFPSRQETFGQTKSEALSCGVPVVAFNETACAEGLVHRANGWVAKREDLADFAAGLCWGHEVMSDPQKRLKVAACARERVEREYAPDVVAKRWATLYSTVMADCPRAGDTKMNAEL